MPGKGKPYLPGDPDGRAAAGGHASKGKPKRTQAQKEADARLARLLEAVPKLPEGHEPPSAMEVQSMARSFSPAALHFASDVLGKEESALSDKFSAANLLLKHGAMVGAAEQEEINSLKGVLKDLREEHQASVKDMHEELTSLRTENAALTEQLEEARSKIRTTPAEEIPLPKVAKG